MATIINNENIENHTVDKYSFKVLSSASNQVSNYEEEILSQEEHSKDENPARRESDIDSSAMSESSKESLIESLMKKTDDMSSNFIKLQMKLESMTEEHQREMAVAKEESFNEGVEVGKKQAFEDSEVNRVNGLEQFSASIATLD